jgi:hypothetical protein
LITEKALDHKLQRRVSSVAQKGLQGHSHAADNWRKASFSSQKDQQLNENWSKQSQTRLQATLWAEVLKQVGLGWV